jgi:hypothetical protein
MVHETGEVKLLSYVHTLDRYVANRTRVSRPTKMPESTPYRPHKSHECHGIESSLPLFLDRSRKASRRNNGQHFPLFHFLFQAQVYSSPGIFQGKICSSMRHLGIGFKRKASESESPDNHRPLVAYPQESIFFYL